MNETTQSNNSISYVTFESVMARFERINRRLFILCVIAFIALIGTNIAWILYENQFEDVVTVDQTVESEDAPAYVSGTGSVDIGNDESASENN